MNELLILVAIALRVAAPDPMGFLTFVLLSVWFLRDQCGDFFGKGRK